MFCDKVRGRKSEVTGHANKFSEKYSIHRTRQNFPDYTPDLEGEDTFSLMAERGLYIIDRVVIEEMSGGVDLKKNVWYIPSEK